MCVPLINISFNFMFCDYDKPSVKLIGGLIPSNIPRVSARLDASIAGRHFNS